MARSIDRRSFLRRAGTAAVVAMGAPLVRPARATAAPNERLVVAVGQWGTETPFAWRGVQGEKPLWDCVYDSLITRDPKTSSQCSRGTGSSIPRVRSTWSPRGRSTRTSRRS